jgi:peptidoglycan/LPS O-acetylase OafA/YrhL
MSSNFLNSSLRERRGLTNFIRLIAALAVLLSHSNPLSGFGPDLSIGKSPLGEIAVSVFFVLSGYFVFSSGLSNGFKDFLVLRIARLFPALIAANFLLAFLIGPLVAFFSGQENYWRILHGPFSYFFNNSILVLGIQSGLSDLFWNVPYPHVVNGSLWTLPTEIKCYISIAFIALLIKFTRRNIFILVAFMTASLFYLLAVQGNNWVNENIHTSTTKLMLLFFSGSLLASLELINRMKNKLFTTAGIIVFLGVLWNSETYAPFFYWTLIPAIAAIPTRLSRYFRLFENRDFSYGFYLWSFPIQQFVMNLGLTTGPFSLSIIAIFIAVIFSLGSWYIIEYPAMKYARKFVKESS